MLVTLAAALVVFAIVISFWEELLCLLLVLVGLAVAGGVLTAIAAAAFYLGVR